MANPAPTINQINAFNATQGTTIDFNIIGGTELVRSNRIYIYDLSDNSLICTHLYVSTESIHELPPNTDGSIVYESGKSSADFVNGAQYYAQIQTFTDIAGTEGGSGLSVAKMFWCLVDPTLTITTIPSTISTTSYNVSATYNANTSVVSNIIQQYQFSLYSATGSLLQSSGVVVGSGEQQGTSTAYDISYNFSGLSVGSSYYVVVDVTTTQGMSVTTQSNTFTVSIDTPTLGEATVVNNACDGYISVTSNLSSEYGGSGSGEIVSFDTDSENVFTKLQVDLEPVQEGTPWVSASDTEPYLMRISPQLGHDYNTEFDTLVGGTVSWNQLIKNGDFASGTTNWTSVNASISASNGELTISASGTSEYNAGQLLDFHANHVYLIDCSYYSHGNEWWYWSASYSYSPAHQLVADAWNPFRAVIKTSADKQKAIFTGRPNISSGAYLKLKNVVHFDLTQMFGSAVADYIYSLETANAGAGVAWFRKYFSKAYYPYDAGTLMSVKTSAHKTTGKNVIKIAVTPYSAQGVTISQDGDDIKVVANNATGYPFTKVATLSPSFPSGFYWLKYSTVGNGIDFRIVDRTVSPAVVLSPLDANGRYEIPSGHNELSVEIAITGSSIANGTYIRSVGLMTENIAYESYVEHIYPLDPNLELRGLFKLENSKLKADGDVYSSSGNVQRKYGVVDLGTLNYNNASATTGLVTATSYLPNQKYYNNNWDNQPRTINSKGYTQRPYYTGGNDDVNKVDHSIGFVGSANGAVAIRDIALAGMTGAQVKAALSGVYLIYPLATPTTETAMPFEANQSIIPNGSEEYVDSRTVPIPVGHLTSYADVYPITGHDEVDVEHTGKNLNPNTGVNYTLATSIPFFLKAGQYVFSTDNGAVVSQDTAIYIQLFDEDGNNITDSGITSQWFVLNGARTAYYGGVNASSRAFTLNYDAYFVIGFNNQIPSNFSALQLELGTTATAYEPYTGQSYHQDIEATYTPTVQENDVYLFKQTGDVGGDRETIELVGGTVAWNQISSDGQLSVGNAEGTTLTQNDVVFTKNSDGSVSLSGTQSAQAYVYNSSKNVRDGTYVSVGDVFLVTASGTSNVPLAIIGSFYNNNTWVNGYKEFNLNDKAGVINKIPQGVNKITGCAISSKATNNGQTINAKVWTNLFNLTQMFGSTIADYIYSLETATAGAGVAFFRNLFPKDYYPYNAGELISVKTSAHKTVGFNQWDEETESGYINSNGAFGTNADSLRSKNFCPCMPNTTYYFNKPSTYTQTPNICWYDANKTFINRSPSTPFPLIPSPSNARYFKLSMWNYGATYNNDVCINISDASKNGTYEPYVENSYLLDSDLELRGMPKLDASNNLYYDGDTYKHDGSVNRKFGKVDLGTLTWQSRETTALGLFIAEMPRDYAYKYNMMGICSKYMFKGHITGTSTAVATLGEDGCGLYYSAGYTFENNPYPFFYVYDTQLSNYTPAQVKSAMSGVMFVYEKQNNLAETADPFEEIQKVTPIYGTEEFVDNRTVPMPVYAKTQYFTRDVYSGYIDLVSGKLVLDETKRFLGKLNTWNTWGVNTNANGITGFYVYANTIETSYANLREITNCKTLPIKNTAWGGQAIGTFFNMGSSTPSGWYYIVSVPNSMAGIADGDSNATAITKWNAFLENNPIEIVQKLAEPMIFQLTPQQIQTFVGVNNVWSEQGDIELSYHIPITNLLVKRQDVGDVSGDWLTLYSQPITQASDMDFTFIDFTNQYGKTYKYALVPLLTQTQSGVEVEVEGGYTVSDEVQSVFDGVFIVDSTGSQKCKANVGYGNVDMNQTVGTITPIGAKYPVVITNSKNQYHNGSISGTIVPDDYYFNGNLSRIDMVNKRDELEQFLTNKRAKIIKDWNGKIWLVMIMDNVSCTFNNNYGMGIVNFSTNWVEVGDPTNQQDLQATGLINVGGV